MILLTDDMDKIIRMIRILYVFVFSVMFIGMFFGVYTWVPFTVISFIVWASTAT